VCRGIYLIPRSAGVDAEVARVFGNLERGRRYVGLVEMRRRLAARAGQGSGIEGLRETECPGWPEPRFSFDGVAPGDYYVTAHFSPRRACASHPTAFPPADSILCAASGSRRGGAVSVNLRN